MRRLASAALALLLVSCVSYHQDGARYGKLSHVSVGLIENKTAEGTLGGLLRRQLQEHLGTTPGFERDRNANWLRLDAKIVSLVNSGIVNAELRDEYARNEEKNAYQTVLYRIMLTVSYTVTDVAEKRTVVHSGTVVGTADLPLMSDREISLRQACLQAVNDVALKIKENLAEQNLEE